MLIAVKDDQRTLKYTDFGLAVEVSDAMLSHAHGRAGTPDYMSPECASDKPYSSKTDVWSLAASFVQV